jgi:malate synthase
MTKLFETMEQLETRLQKQAEELHEKDDRMRKYEEKLLHVSGLQPELNEARQKLREQDALTREVQKVRFRTLFPLKGFLHFFGKHQFS